MNTLRIITAAFVSIMASIFVYAEDDTMCIALKDGKTIECKVADIDKITFNTSGGQNSDEPGVEGKASITIDGKTVDFAYKSYAMDTTDDGKYCDIVFSNYDPMAPDRLDNLSMLMISVKTNGDDVPLGTFVPDDEYDITLVVNADYTNYTERFEYYCEEDRATSGNLTISKSGGNYIIDIPKLGLWAMKGSNEDELNAKVYPSKFKYTGSLNRLMDNLIE